MAIYDQYIDYLINKDEETFELIYNETKHAVYSMIVSILKDRSISQDIMQETYITMLEKIHQYKKGNNFLSWLLVIARNKAIDYYRHYKKEIVIDATENEYIFPCLNPSGERSLLIQEMLNSLSEIERSIFLLRVVQNLKNREISKILNIPLGTVLWHYSKAMKKINQLKGGESCEIEEQN